MAGIGEASAIIGVLQVGFSLAVTLQGYVGDYKDAREDIISLATDIEATLTQIERLTELLKTNKQAKILDDNGVKLAEICRDDSNRIVEKLVKLLTKTGVKDQNIKPTDIKIFSRASWLLLKPRVQVAKRELDSIRIHILLALNCINARAGSTPAERDAANERIPGLARSRQLARQRLREARREEQFHSRGIMANAASSPTRAPHPRPTRIPTGDSGFASRPTGQYHSHSRYRRPPIPGYSLDTLDGENTDAVAAKLREDVKEGLEREEAMRKEKAADETRIRNEAVQTYKDDVRRVLSELQQEADDVEARLIESFGGQLSDEQVKDFAKAQKVREIKLRLEGLSLDPDLFADSGDRTDRLDVKPTEDYNGNGSRPTSVVSNRKKRWWWARKPLPRSRERTRERSDLESEGHVSSVSSSYIGSKLSSKTLFFDVVLTYSLSGLSIWTADSLLKQHYPCDRCDFDVTLRTLSKIPQNIMEEAYRRLDARPDLKGYGLKLHSAEFPGDIDSRSKGLFDRRKMDSSMASGHNFTVLLVYTAGDRRRDKKELGPDDSISVAESYGRGEHAKTDEGIAPTKLAEMRTWLKDAGFGASKVDELENLLRQEHSKLPTGVVQRHDKVSKLTERDSRPLAGSDSGSSNQPKESNIVEVIEEDGTDDEADGIAKLRGNLKKGSTKFPKSLVNRYVFRSMGYTGSLARLVEEEEDFFVVRIALDKERIDAILAMSKTMSNAKHGREPDHKRRSPSPEFERQGTVVVRERKHSKYGTTSSRRYVHDDGTESSMSSSIGRPYTLVRKERKFRDKAPERVTFRDDSERYRDFDAEFDRPPQGYDPSPLYRTGTTYREEPEEMIYRQSRTYDAYREAQDSKPDQYHSIADWAISARSRTMADIPRASSLDDLNSEISEDEDLLDDDSLRNKMLVRYTGGRDVQLAQGDNADTAVSAGAMMADQTPVVAVNGDRRPSLHDNEDKKDENEPQPGDLRVSSSASWSTTMVHC
jgi:hypothetical protein